MPYDPEKRKAYYLSFRNWLIQNPEANQHYREYNREYRKKHKTQIRENQKNYIDGDHGFCVGKADMTSGEEGLEITTIEHGKDFNTKQLFWFC
jgi:hypothetical protein